MEVVTEELSQQRSEFLRNYKFAYNISTKYKFAWF